MWGPQGSIVHPYQGWTGGHTMVTVMVPLSPQVSSWAPRPIPSLLGQDRAGALALLPRHLGLPCCAGGVSLDPARLTWAASSASIPSQPEKGRPGWKDATPSMCPMGASLTPLFSSPGQDAPGGPLPDSSDWLGWDMGRKAKGT